MLDLVMCVMCGSVRAVIITRRFVFLNEGVKEAVTLGHYCL